MRWPWKRYPEPDGQSDTGGREARERAERALRDVRQRRAEQEGMRRWFRVDAAENHYGQGAEQLFLGRKQS